MQQYIDLVVSVELNTKKICVLSIILIIIIIFSFGIIYWEGNNKIYM